MKFYQIKEGVGRITKQNQTVDVGPNEIKTQAAKFGNTVDKDGRPPTLSKKVKGSSTNVLFNLGLTENASSDEEDEFHRKLDKLVHKTFGHSSDEKKKKKKKKTDEKAPPGREKQVKALKKKFDDPGAPYAIAWAQHNKKKKNEDLDENVLHYSMLSKLSEAKLGELASASEIYVDMDGVLADFFGEWAKLMKVDHYSKIDDIDINVALQKIRDTDEFWLNLPMLPQAKQLLNLIKKIKGSYNICSSPLADDPNSEPHKREWIKRNLDFFPPNKIIITHNKPKYATNQDGTPNILIDDFGKNISSWEAAGGIGFKYKDHKFERTAKAIQQHMQEPVSEGAEITMWTNPEYQGADVDDKYYKKQPVKIVDVSKLTPFEPADKMDPKDNHDNMMKFVDKIKAGEKVKPIVIVPHEGKLLIVDGHHRYFAHKKAGVDKIRAVIADPKDLTWRDDVPESVKENFADGKKKGKSRPGRVKKSGASCNGSVTDLRKRAKNASGEKAKMYHWCANMKSGRKKGK